jgi:hypothetical protein
MNYAYPLNGAAAQRANGYISAIALCDPGDWATGGGFYGHGIVFSGPVFDGIFTNGETRTVRGPIFPTGWEAMWDDYLVEGSPSRQNGRLEVFVICQDLLPLHIPDVIPN